MWYNVFLEWFVFIQVWFLHPTRHSFDPDGIVLLGSSFFSMWRNFQTDISSELPLFNSGVASATTLDMLRYHRKLLGNAKTVVYYAGTNDIETGGTPEMAMANFEKFVSLYGQNRRFIYLYPILTPRHISHGNTEKIRAFQRLPKLNSVDYIDLENIPFAYRADGQHVTENSMTFVGQVLLAALSRDDRPNSG